MEIPAGLTVNELRVGNWVRHINKNGAFDLQVEQILTDGIDVNHNGVWMLKFNTIQGIELTPEILTASGFTLGHSGEYYENWRNEKQFYISKCIKEMAGGYGDKVGHWYCGDNHTEIPNLHWLQNYYYFNYHKELEVNF